MGKTKAAMKILIVDDSATSRKLLKEVLLGAQADYEISQVESGSAALESVALQPPDIILLDIMMPGMNGFEVCRVLKADKKTAAIPVLFITALDTVQDMIRGFQMGAADYITKPFLAGAEEVRARVTAHLRIKQAEEGMQEKMEETEKMYKLTMGSAMRVIEMKMEVNKLCEELGRPEP